MSASESLPPRHRTPAPRDLGSHLEAWSDMICAFAGLPPEHAADVSTAGP